MVWQEGAHRHTHTHTLQVHRQINVTFRSNRLKDKAIENFSTHSRHANKMQHSSFLKRLANEKEKETFPTWKVYLLKTSLIYSFVLKVPCFALRFEAT